MNPGFELFGHFFWAICLATQALQYLFASRRLARAHAGQPGKAHAAAVYLRRGAIGMAVPWLIMGCGELGGGSSGVWAYFRPQDGNPFVLAWLASLMALSLIFCLWVFLADGARKIVELKLSLNGRPQTSPGKIRFFAAAGPFWILLWILLVVRMGVPLPK